MKKITKILFILMTLILFIGCGKDEDKILDYLEGKYKEDFIIKNSIPTRKGGTMAIVIPKRYLGTPKERDKFYEAGVTYRDGEIRKDDCIWVKNRESIEAYVKLDLEKLFGKNIIIALDGGKYRNGNFKEDLELLKNSVTEEEKEENSFQIEGGIYIFGRVESEKDREKYRREIYEFIQYLKQEGMFEYVNVVIRIYDERCLAPSYEEVVEKLKEEREIQKNSTDYKKIREKLLSTLTKEYSQMTEKEKQEKLNSIIRSDMVDEKGWTNDYSYAQIYQYVIWSPKFLKNTTNTLLKSYKPIEYNNIKEIKLLDSFKIDYNEYDEKALYNNEWGD